MATASGIAVDGIGRAMVPAGARRGYHVSTVIMPWYRPTPGGRAALSRFVAMYPDKAVVWRREGSYDWWLSLDEHNRRLKLVAAVKKRQRGLRTTQRELAARLKCGLGTVARMLTALERTGLLRIERTRGWRGRTVVRMFHRPESPPCTPPMHGRNIATTAATTDAVAPAENPLEGEFWERLRAQAEARRAEINRETPW